MNDFARLYQTHAMDELLESKIIFKIDWPVCFYDLNPIQHVWDALVKGFLDVHIL